MEKIDLKTYKNKDLALNHLYREEVKDTIIEYGVFKDEIIKNNFIKGSPYQTKKTYYKSNNQIKAESNYFYKIPIGISKKYDEVGNLLEEKDWDKLEKRTFSVEDLITKMKIEFSIDLLDPINKAVSIDMVPFAYVVNTYSNNSPVIRVIKIDARTGNFLSDVLIQPKK